MVLVGTAAVDDLISTDKLCWFGQSIGIIRIGVGLLEARLSALEHFLSELDTVFSLSWVFVKAAHVLIKLGRTLLLDDTHAGC